MPTLTSTTDAPVVAAVAQQEAFLLLANRASLRGHPALINLAAGTRGSSSLTSQYSLFGLDGYDNLSSVSEGAAVSETAITMARRTIAVSRRALRRDFSDMMATIDATGAINPMRLAMDGFMACQKSLTGQIAALASGFTASKGTSGVDFDHDTFQEAKAALIDAKVPGPYLLIIPETFFSKWMMDLEGRGGLTQWRSATEQMQMLRGPGYQGMYDNVDIFTCDLCPTSGSDRIGTMFGRGAVGYAEMEVVFPQSAFILMKAGPMAVEEVREGTKGVTDIITHYHSGVVEIEDERGVQILAAA